MPELQLNDDFIHDSMVCAIITEVNPTIDLDIFAIALNYWLNFDRFVLSIGYLFTEY